jgi:hypothetical protein
MRDEVLFPAFLAFVEMISQNIFVAAGEYSFNIFFDGEPDQTLMILVKFFPVIPEYLFDGIFPSDGFQHIGVD